MFCKKCGSSLPDNAKFCGACGTMVEEQQPAQASPAPVSVKPEPAAVEPAQPKTPKINKKTGMMIGAVAAVLAVVLVITALFGGAGSTVTKAFSKSLGAYAAMLEKLQLPDMAAVSESGKYNQELQMWFEDGADELDGLGIRMEMAYNQSGKEAAIIAAPFYEDTDLLTAQIQLKDNALYIGCPELMEDSYLMVDTMTIGEDLADKDIPDLEDMSFNLFTLAEEIQQHSRMTKEQKQTLEKAGAALVKSFQVEALEKKAVKVNGKKLSCKVYELVIPQEAMEDYLDILEDVVKDMDMEKTADILEDAGLVMPGYNVYANEDVLRDSLDQMKDFVDEVGDFAVEVAIHKGYIVALNSEFEVWDTEYSMNVQLGGGENYVDDLYFEMKDEDEYGFILSSEGNHAMTKGVFTDETVLTELFAGKESGSVSCETSWEPKAKEDNFEMVLEVEGDKFTMEGTLVCTKDSLTINLPELEADGITVGVRYDLSGYKAPVIRMETILAFSEMDEDDLLELGEQIVENAEDWAGQIEENYSGLVDYIAEMLYYLY